MQLNVIDLFAGAGGLSLGAARAGFKVVSAVEIDKHALETHVLNFPLVRHLDTDVASLEGRALLAQSGLQADELSGLIGGPPCQGFSSIGRQDPLDARNDLFAHFMRLVAETLPAFYVAENVPGILHGRNADALKRALSNIPRGYVVLPPFKAEAYLFGAPTTRTRLFFVGYDPVRLNALDAEAFEAAKTKHRTTVRDALAGLPSRIQPTWLSESDGLRPVAMLEPSFFNDRAQRNVPKGIGCVYSLNRFRQDGLTSGNMRTRHAEATATRYGALKCGEMDQISKSVRLNPDGYCPTLRAGTGSDKGSYQAVRPIHFSAARVITPREAARLQGFPDWFALHRTKWHSFRQIGNSVSPIVAEAILKVIRKHIRP